jgi:hydrogenase/urease accessory protein HupE
LAVLLGMLAGTPPAAAHPVPFSYLDIHLQPEGIEVALVVHVFDLAHDLQIEPPGRLLDARLAAERADAIRALLMPRLQLIADRRTLNPSAFALEVLPERHSLRLRFSCPAGANSGLIEVVASIFPYDAKHQTFVNVYEGEALTSQAILDRTHTSLVHFAGTRQGILALLRKFVPAGITHILSGPDHVLFLIGLLLLGGTARRLLLVVSAFTVAHSITLSLAVLNVVNPPARLVEPAIALSIVCLGADNLLARDGRDLRAWIALCFGFIHGFGFAGVLREMELPGHALGWSLFAFNFGVEIGQVLIVAVCAAALSALRSRSDRAARQVAFAGSLAVMLAGVFWFVQRVFFRGGLT